MSVLGTQLCPLCNPMDCSPLLLCPCNSPGKNTEVGCHSLCLGVFLIQGSNPGPLHCRQILYCLSHQGSSYIHKHALSNTLLPFITLTYYVLDQLRIRKISFYFAFSYWFFDAFPFCMQIQISIVSLLSEKVFLIRQVCWQQIPSVSVVWECLYSPLLVKDNFTGYRILD